MTEESTGHQYRFVLPPHRLEPDRADRCVDVTCDLARKAACMVVSGSIDLPGVHDRLRDVVTVLGPTPVLIDTSGTALDAALISGATLVKPSARELAGTVGRALRTEGDIIDAAQQVVERSNIGALLVSIGPGGAVLARRCSPPVRFRAPTVATVMTEGTELCDPAVVDELVPLAVKRGVSERPS